jgi:hypothetical protein
VELQMEISEKRLTEIQNLGAQNQELASKVLGLENEVCLLLLVLLCFILK